MVLTWLLVSVATIAAYMVFGLTGFGGAILLIPLLSLVLPIKMVVPLVTTLGFLAAVTVTMRERGLAVTKELWRIVPGMLLGVGTGVYLLAKLPSHWILPALGVLILGFGVNGFMRPGLKRQVSQAFAFPIGLLAGLVGALFGTSGPIYVIYLSRRINEKSELRATMTSIFTVSSSSRLLGYMTTGLMLHGRLLLIGIALYPFVLLGIFIGNRLHHALSAIQVRRGINLLLVASGITILLKAL